MLKKILNLEHAQQISKIEQKTMKGIPECWIYAIEAGCVLVSAGEHCPIDKTPGVCDTNRLCC